MPFIVHPTARADVVQLRANEGGAVDHVTGDRATAAVHPLAGNFTATYNSSVEPSCCVTTHVNTAPLLHIDAA